MMYDYNIKAEMIEETEPITFREFKKTFWNGSEWEIAKFYEIRKRTDQLKNIKDWLENKYGKPCYGKTFWITFNGIVMHEKIYTHWKLCE